MKRKLEMKASPETISALYGVLIWANKVLEDARGDVDEPKKRIWPIRATNYRGLKAAIEEWKRAKP